MQGDLEQIAEMAIQKKRILGSLTAATYHADAQIAWRAVEAMGLAADRIAEQDPEYAQSQPRRLYWLICEESGGVCYRAPEAMAEIIRHRPKLHDEYVPIVVSLLNSMADEDLEGFRAGVLWAIGRLGALADEHLADALPAIVAALDNPDPQVRGMAVWCLGQVGRAEHVTGRADLAADEGPVDFYEDRQLSRTNVKKLVQRVLSDR